MNSIRSIVLGLTVLGGLGGMLYLVHRFGHVSYQAMMEFVGHGLSYAMVGFFVLCMAHGLGGFLRRLF